MSLSSSSDIEHALQRLGDLLQFRRQRFAIAIVGGAALNLLRVVARTTNDVDILAFADPVELVQGGSGALTEAPTPPSRQSWSGEQRWRGSQRRTPAR